jgi:hypothetical protein
MRIRRIVGVYRPTAKNGLVKELFDRWASGVAPKPMRTRATN